MWHPLDRWTHPAPWYTPQALWWLGVVCTLLYGGLRIYQPAIGEAGGSLVALTGLVAVLVWGRGIRGSAPLWLLLAAVLVQLLSWVLIAWQHPDWAASNPKLDRMAKWFLFIGVAWWLGGSTRHTLLLWGLALFGLLLMVTIGEQAWPEWQRALTKSWYRPAFGIQNAQHAALFFGAGLLGLIVFAGRCWHIGSYAWLRRLVWLVLFSVLLCGVAVTQTRGIWLGLLLAGSAVAMAALLWLWHYRHPRHLMRWMALGLVGLVLVGAVAGVAFHDTVERRLAKENEAIANILSGDVASVPYSSVGVRFHTWRAAGQWFVERPLVGWGDEARGLVIKNTDWLPDHVRQQFGHLHNTTLEILVAYGVLGLGVMLLLTAWVAMGTWRAWRAGVMPGDMALFGLGFLIFFVVVNQFESYLSFWSGTYLFNLVLGGLVSHIWYWQVRGNRGDHSESICLNKKVG